MTENILEISHLSLAIDEKKIIKDLSFAVKDKKITCLVGESGSGKSLTISAVLGLLPSCAKVSPKARISFQGDSIFSIYQDPINSFNISVKVGKQLYQMAKGFREMSRKEFDAGISRVLCRIGFENPAHVLNKYPFELSGGMLQRLMIADAIFIAPSLIIADEPTTSLDVSIQKEILREFRAINRETQTAILVVTHDFGVVAELADEVVVMCEGELVETGDVFQVFDHPKKEYTKALLEASFREVSIDA